MLQRWKNQVPLAAGAAGLCVLLIGTTLVVTNSNSLQENWSQSQEQVLSENPKSAVLQLVSVPPAQRALQLQAIAQLPRSLDRARARYLLASDAINQQQGKIALNWLEGLEQSYPILAAPITLKRAQAYELTGDPKAQATWQDLLKRYGDNPIAAEALFVLGRNNPQYWQSAIARFPSHPRTLEIARFLLRQNPNQPQLLLLLAKHDYETDTVVLDQLVNKYAAQLQSQDWEAIAVGYWKNQLYKKAAAAYAKAPRTPVNNYRIGRGLQLSNQKTEAIAAYQQLIRNFPNAKESGTALLHKAQMAETADALIYLERVISSFPQQAGEALVEKAQILDTLQSKKSAAQTRQLLLTRYGDSNAAAEYRWKIAQQRAAVKDYRGAWQWAQPLPTRNPKSILAPRAGFWVGKWALKLGRKDDAKAAFEYVLSQFPQSYYAWRSAAILGLDVGNFDTVRQLTPQVVPPTRSLLPAGSATLRELYLLGQSDAWTLWQAEFHNDIQPTVAEQFTDGLMRIANGENLLGISQVATLEDRETPQEQAEYQALSQQLAYWQARYPFPYLEEIETWSQERKLNPLLVTALIRQESRFEPKIRSVAGATGLMQVMPGTAKWIAQKSNIKEYNAENPNDNIKLGTWFLDYTHQEYNNNSLLAVASYNAGPGNVSKWVNQLGINFDADEFVEAIPFDETKGYVRQVFGNYWNYLRLYNPEISQLMQKYSVRSPKVFPN